MDYIVENVYTELLDDGYDEDEIEEALEYALTEAKVTFGHDTPTTEKKKQGLLGTAKKYLSNLKKSAKQAVATGARKVAKGALGVARKMEGGDTTPSPAQTKPRSASTYRGAGAGTKERVSSGSYTPPTQKKAKPAQPVSDPWEGSASTPKTKTKPAPKAKAKPAPKRKRSKLDDLIGSIQNEQMQISEVERQDNTKMFVDRVNAMNTPEFEKGWKNSPSNPNSPNYDPKKVMHPKK